MKEMDLKQMENLQGGLSLAQHVICGMMGFAAASCSFGIGATFGYLCCISLLYLS
jgi:lactobin A/cerein 7B family class IIb bacteriocin